MLREFWFQIFLALAGVAMGIVAGLSDGTQRKVWATTTVCGDSFLYLGRSSTRTVLRTEASAGKR